MAKTTAESKSSIPFANQRDERKFLKSSTRSTSLSGTKDFGKLRTAEADKIRCGRRYFAALDVDFSVVMGASEI